MKKIWETARPWKKGDSLAPHGYEDLHKLLDEIVDKLNEIEPVLKWAKMQMNEEKAEQLAKYLKGDDKL